MQKYKALILDLDGTTIPIRKDSLPSENVKKAIAEANKKLYVGIATSRPFHAMEYLLDHLTLSSPCIINGGSEIIDPETRKILCRQPVNEEDLRKVFVIVKEMGLTMEVDFHERSERMKKNINLHTVLSGYTFPAPEATVNEFLKRISYITTISSHKMPSSEKGKQYASVNHVAATKQHGILQVAELLKIQTHEMIGVGDGHNDLPLLMACGLRVAMGNAADDLKAIADYIAPRVEDDGVVDVIRKFVS